MQHRLQYVWCAVWYVGQYHTFWYECRFTLHICQNVCMKLRLIDPLLLLRLQNLLTHSWISTTTILELLLVKSTGMWFKAFVRLPWQLLPRFICRPSWEEKADPSLYYPHFVQRFYFRGWHNYSNWLWVIKHESTLCWKNVLEVSTKKRWF